MSNVCKMPVDNQGRPTKGLRDIVKLTDDFDLQAVNDLIAEGKISYRVVQVRFRSRFGWQSHPCIVPNTGNEALNISSWISVRAEAARQEARARY